MTRSHSEVEAKYDVEDATPLPELADLPDVARVDGPASHHLEATYFDTADLALGRNGITLRRRTGGDDEGWQLRLPVAGALHEIRASLGRSTRTPPVALRRIVQGIVRDRTLCRVATLVTERSVVELRDSDESLLAIIRDDRVVATRTDPAGDEGHSWREWEVEQHGARRKLVTAADRRLRDAGARLTSPRSKFGRVVGLEAWPEPVAPHPPGKHASEHEVLGHHLESLTAELHRLDPLARADVPDAVHQLRTVARRLRGILTSFDRSFDNAATDPIRDELHWIGDVLGRPRDLEVLRSRLDDLVLAESAQLVRGRPGQWIDSQLRAAHRSAYREALDAMASERYFAMVDALDSWQDAPPWADQRDRPAHKRLGKALDREWASLERAVALASAGDDAERPILLHEVRKAAKRTRFAAETPKPVLGSDARTMGRTATRIQGVLGDYHDTVVAADRLLQLADAACADGRDTFTYGVLCVRLEAEAAEHDRAFERLWGKVRKARRRRGRR